MSYVNKNANLLLLFLVTLGFVLLVGTTVFYANNLSRLNDRYEDKVDSLKTVEKDLNTKLKVIEQIRQDLKLKSQREQTFTEKYTEIRDVKQTLQEEKTTLTKEKEGLEGEVESAQRSLKEIKNKLIFEEAKTRDLDDQVTGLESKLRSEERANDQLRDEKSSLQSQLNTCQGT